MSYICYLIFLCNNNNTFATVSTLSCFMTQSRPSSVLTALVKSTPPGMLCAPLPPLGAAARPPPLALPPPVLPPPDAAVWRAEVPLKLLLPPPRGETLLKPLEADWLLKPAPKV